MKKFKYFIFGFLGFLIVTTVDVSVGVLVFSMIETWEKTHIAILLILIIIINALLCSIIDVVRRRYMIQKPLEEILYATKAMARGNFKIDLKPNHSYGNFDEFDLIKYDLNKMASELSKSEILKNDFIANVSHEIKTPLQVIKNYANLLNDNCLSVEERTKYLNSLIEACGKLNKLVMNILQLNKLENQRLRPSLTKFNISDLLAEQILQFESLIENKKINLRCEIEEDLVIESEASYLEIIFNNLISNAIKFTKDYIYVSLIKVDNSFIVVIKDNGCGMDEETGKHIFDKFYQGDTSHYNEGNGLGLALVKKVIDILGGEINVSSEVGLGTTFKIIIR